MQEESQAPREHFPDEALSNSGEQANLQTVAPSRSALQEVDSNVNISSAAFSNDHVSLVQTSSESTNFGNRDANHGQQIFPISENLNNNTSTASAVLNSPNVLQSPVFNKGRHETPPPSTRKRRSAPDPLECLKADDPIILTINHLTAECRDVSRMKSIHFKKLLEKVPHFIFPEEVNMPMLLKTAEKLYLKKLVNEGFFNFCYVYLERIDKEIFAYSFAVTKNYNRIYLCDTAIDANDYSREDIKTSVHEFCDVTVQEFFKKYGIHAKYILYDSNIVLANKGGTEEQPYFRINCFSTLFWRLQNLRATWVIQDENYDENDKIIRNYKKSMEDLKNEFLLREYTLGEGTEKILQLYTELPSVLNMDLKKVYEKTLVPVAMGANMMHPKFRGRRVISTDSFYDKMLVEFMDLALPSDFEPFYAYRDNKIPFQTIFNLAYDPVRFWSKVKENYSEFAEFGMEMLVLPAIMPKINRNSIREALSKWSEDRDLTAFALSLISNDCV